MAFLMVLTMFALLPGCARQSSGSGIADSTTQTQSSGTEDSDTALLPDLSAKEIADAIMAVFDGQELSPMTRYYFGAAENAAEYFEPERSGWLITGKMEVDPVMDLLSDYAFYIPKGWYAFEVDVLKVKDTAGLAKATEYLHARRTHQDSPDLRFYNPEDVPVIQDARIFTVGNYAILLATTDNDKAQEAIVKLLGDKAQINTKNENPGIPVTSDEETTPETEFSYPVESVAVVDIESEAKIDVSMLEPEPKKNLPPDQITEIPAVTVCKYSRNTMFLLGGSCEEGAVIHIKGGTVEINSRSDYGDWLVEVPIDPKNVSVLYMSATVPGKAESDVVKYVVRPQKGITMYEDSGIYGVVVGNDYFSWFADCIPGFVGSDVLKDNDVEKLKNRYAKKVTDLRSRELDTEIIVLLIPSPMRLYAEHVPSYIKQTKGITLTDQFKDAMSGAGVTVIDLSEVMFAHKYDSFKIFHRTDSHWSDYGAYFGYVELMNYIAKKFPDAAPRPSSDFEFYNKKVYFGDIYATLGLERNVLREYTTFVNFKFEPPGGFRDIYNGNSVVIDHNVTSKNQTTKSNLTDLELPSAYIMRDSFCGPIFNFLTDRFSKITWQAMWDYSFNLDRIAKENPDYLIYIINERNIKNIMYE
jgi:alginate O-acetyltransferase complex protein AlgJ